MAALFREIEASHMVFRGGEARRMALVAEATGFWLGLRGMVRAE